MKFAKLAEYFQKLEATASRNLMVEILARLFSEASADEIGKIVYLTQGRVAPLYEPVEFGLADKMVVKALAKAYKNPSLRSGTLRSSASPAGLESDEDDVTDEYKKAGDVGTVAELLSSKVRRRSSRLPVKSQNVSEVFLELKRITEISGEGSVEKKIQILADLFKENDSLSNRFLARIPVDKMRLGFSDMTVLEGLSWMIDGTKLHKEKIEAAYSIRPDLGYVSTQVKIGGIGGIRGVRPKVGTPILVMKAERLTNAQEILEKGGGKIAVEPKLDGLRTQLHIKKSEIRNPKSEIKLYSRGMENVTAMYPDLVAAARKEIKAEEVILDGEAIGFDPKTGKFVGFQQTTQRKRKYDIEAFSKSIPVKLVVYDVLFYEGKSYIDEPYMRRRELVEKLTKGNKTIISNRMEITDNAAQLEKFFQECLRQNLEGIMAKRLEGVYQAGARGWNWIKLKKSYDSKLTDTIDAVVMGIDYGQGKRNEFGVGAFLVGIYDQKTDSYKTLSKIGTGLTDGEWRELRVKSEKLKVKSKPFNYDVNKLMNCDIWLKPKLVGVFIADELTKSPMHTAGWAMRFPRLQSWIDDKKPEDTTSLKEIGRLVELQKK